MPKGMAVPVRSNRRGGAQLIEGTPYTEQVIRVGLQPNTSRNPFQAGDGVEVGISERVIFSVNDVSAQAQARSEIVRFFARLREADLARLSSGSEGLSMQSDGETLSVTVRYVDLEADRENEIETNLKDAQRTSPSIAYTSE